eukprot:Nitzschia sp. Nitz4//scaffold44_size153857//67756//69207//NITZ4_002721-RA/size153857-processed-gene-0.123-mRNA-1//1//CDS//3329552157//8986//frame0
MTSYMEHMEPEENYGGGDYYDDDESEILEEEYYDDGEYIEEVVDDDYYEELPAPQEETAPQGSMAAMIAAAASKRTNRLETGGPKKMTQVEKAPDQGLDMAAMIAKKANARNERIEAGGQLKVREIPKAHKNVFVNVALEAARVGTLTRLNEHTVTAVAQPKEEEVWKGPSGLRTDHLRSTMFMAVNEAAALGAMRKLKPVEVTNYDQNEYHEEEEPEDIDKMTDEHGRRVVRQLYLIDRRLQEEKKSKEEMWSAENVSNMVQYNSMDEVALPSATAPKWKPKKSEKTQRELMDSIANGVAERAWERNYRLNRPKANLMMTRQCNCKFCVNPNPYQTHKYKQMEEKGIEEAKAPVLEPSEPSERSKRSKSSKGWSGSVKHSRNVKPGEWSESSSYTPIPTAVPKYTPTRSPPKPILDVAPVPVEAPPPEPEPEQYSEFGPGVVVLLDETTTWGRKREKTLKPKKSKKKTKKKKNTGGGGCTIM